METGATLKVISDLRWAGIRSPAGHRRFEHGGSTVSTTQFQYDPIWQQKAISNPYAPGEALLWNNIVYDVLNRTISISPPSGGSTQFNFVGNTVTVTDWKAKYGGMDVSEAGEAKQLRDENTRLKKLVVELSLDKEMQKAVIAKKGRSS